MSTLKSHSTGLEIILQRPSAGSRSSGGCVGHGVPLLKKMTVLVRILAWIGLKSGPYRDSFSRLAVSMWNQYQRRLEGQLVKSCAAIGKSAAHGSKTARFNAFFHGLGKECRFSQRAPRTPRSLTPNKSPIMACESPSYHPVVRHVKRVVAEWTRLLMQR
jgi:hypothetical protein